MRHTGKRGRALLPAATLLLALLIPSSQPLLHGQRHRSHQEATRPAANCFHSSDPRDIPLWSHEAPGAAGADPCRDIPFLRLYRPSNPPPNVLSRAIVVVPGGGYDRLSDVKEQAPVARFLASRLGITAFVLYYRLVQQDGTYRYPVPMWDGRRALRLVRSNAQRFGVDPHRIGLLGFSAGGHLASTLALHPADDFGATASDAIDRADAAPNFLALGYPVISMLPDQYAAESSLHHLLFGYRAPELPLLEGLLSGQDNVSRQTPPVFLFESKDDRRISPENSILFADALRKAQIPTAFHLFAHGVHGAGLAEGIPDEEQWPSLFAAWVQRF